MSINKKGKQKAVLQDFRDNTQEYASMPEHIEQDATWPTHTIPEDFYKPVQKPSTIIYYPYILNPAAESSKSKSGRGDGSGKG